MLKIILKFSWVIVLLLSACDKADKSPAEISLTPEVDTVDYNGSFTMSWSAKAVDYCIASGDWTGNIRPHGSKTIGPLKRDSFYILSCYQSGKEFSDSVTVKVRAAQIPQINLSASPVSIGFKDSTTLNWSSRNVKDCIADGDWSGQKPLNGSINIEGLETSSEYILNCSGPQGEVSARVSINVYEAGITVPRINLTATPAEISYNGSTTLSWNSQNADICKASGNWFGSKSTSGMETIKQLKTDSRFVLTCTIAGGGGGEGVDVARVSVEPAPAPTVTLTASSNEISGNGSTTLRWSSSHAYSCIATGDWSGTKSISGAETISGLNKKSMFNLNCSGAGGQASDSVTITLKKGNP